MRKTVLVADDSSHMRKILKEMLTNGGYRVVGEAGNGKEAVELYDKFSPDVTLIDISMPDTDGIDALKLIKHSDPEAKVVMISTMNQQKEVIEAIRLGAADFFIKPVHSARVFEAIERALNA